jgi:hypothetical protein
VVRDHRDDRGAAGGVDQVEAAGQEAEALVVGLGGRHGGSG